eukprot:TRINITY_DN2527_c0_g1_i1.p1 TRINITY_DN2527_c0_g1~~TRINITY_DN2527_c0_g1_i1.p1  ORF type:complete len:277 (+),score=60.17 TRINITY_DN2527_c0_g1_i1:33-833(+)
MQQSMFSVFTRNDPFRVALPENAPLVTLVTTDQEMELRQDQQDSICLELESLPNEMLVYIMRHLNDASLGRMRRTSKRMAVMAQDASLWTSLIRQQNWVYSDKSLSACAFYYRRMNTQIWMKEIIELVWQKGSIEMLWNVNPPDLQELRRLEDYIGHRLNEEYSLPEELRATYALMNGEMLKTMTTPLLSFGRLLPLQLVMDSLESFDRELFLDPTGRLLIPLTYSRTLCMDAMSGVIIWKGTLGPDIVKSDSWSKLLIADANLAR